MRRVLRILTAICLTLILAHPMVGDEPELDRDTVSLDALRRIGKAHYENDQFKEAAEDFRACLQRAPLSATDHFNLALVLMRDQKHEEALLVLKQTEALDPKIVGVHYLRGIIQKRENRFVEALDSLTRVLQAEPSCRGAHYNAGICYKNLERYDESIEAFKTAALLAPNHPSAHYQLIALYRRKGDVENVQRQREKFLALKDTVDASEKTTEALERSRYTVIRKATDDRASAPVEALAAIRFVDVGESMGLVARRPTDTTHTKTPLVIETTDADVALVAIGGAVTLGDYDGDGDPDIYAVYCDPNPDLGRNKLYRNDGDTGFVDVTEAAGVGDVSLGLHATFGDYDNDGALDLYVANAGPNVLYRNKGDGTFENVSQRAGVDDPNVSRNVVFVDYDHDNDLDIYVGNAFSRDGWPTGPFTFPNDLEGTFDTLLRNNGNGTFSDETDEAGLLVDYGKTTATLFADFDGDDDVDLFIAGADEPAHLFTNARMGRMKGTVPFSPPISSGVRAATEGDFDRDGQTDLVVAMDNGLALYRNDGGRFSRSPIPLPECMAKTGATHLEPVDVNNDGWLDLLVAGDDRLHVLAGVGPGRFRDISNDVGLDHWHGIVADTAAGDLDGDGDMDIVVQARDRGLTILRNDAKQPANWLAIKPKGKKVNRCAYGATIEITAANHYQKRVVRGGDVHFGLGSLDHVDVVRIVWPNGVAQNIVRPPINKTLAVEEHVRVSASCGFLFAFNGTKFELVNEILGIGPLGVPMAPGVYHQPDSTELTLITADQLVPQNGFYELRLTEDLRELMYADMFTLRAVDHPSSLEIVPNEMFKAPPFPEDRFFAVAQRIPPQSAENEDGLNVLPLVLEHDKRFPEFPFTRYDGLAEWHSLTLDFGALPLFSKATLFLDAWIAWPESSTVIAISQDPGFAIQPLKLERQQTDGTWTTMIESAGLPTSKGIVVPIELTNLVPGEPIRLRLSTNLCVYFDRIFLSTTDYADTCRVTEMPVDRASLRWRGFCEYTRDRLGYETFNYDEVTQRRPWYPPSGMLTRYGDVTELLTEAEDMYVVFGPGDELVMRFAATDLPPLPAGWTRDFIFYANGWVKDGDLNTKFSETVTPLPFHGMKMYPYPAGLHYPDSPALHRYQVEYNTRPGRPTVRPQTTR